MADEEKSFEELLKAAPGGGTVSLVGTLAQTCSDVIDGSSTCVLEGKIPVSTQTER